MALNSKKFKQKYFKTITERHYLLDIVVDDKHE